MQFWLKYEKQKLYNFWQPFSFKKTVWNVVWKFERPAIFLPEKCANCFSNCDNTGRKLQKQSKFLFGKIQRTLKNKNLTNIKIYSAQTSKMIRRKISVKNITASKACLDKRNAVLTTLRKFFDRRPNIFWPQSKNNMSLEIFVKKCMYILSIAMDTKKAVSTELPGKSDTESSKSFGTISEFSFKK